MRNMGKWQRNQEKVLQTPKPSYILKRRDVRARRERLPSFLEQARIEHKALPSRPCWVCSEQEKQVSGAPQPCILLMKTGIEIEVREDMERNTHWRQRWKMVHLLIREWKQSQNMEAVQNVNNFKTTAVRNGLQELMVHNFKTTNSFGVN